MRTILSALLIDVAAQAPATRDTALFYGVRQCLAVTDKQQLNEGDRLLILAVGLAATEARAGVIREPVADSVRWEALSRRAAREGVAVVAARAIQYELFFAVRSTGTGPRVHRRSTSQDDFSGHGSMGRRSRVITVKGIVEAVERDQFQ